MGFLGLNHIAVDKPQLYEFVVHLLAQILGPGRVEVQGVRPQPSVAHVDAVNIGQLGSHTQLCLLDAAAVLLAGMRHGAEDERQRLVFLAPGLGVHRRPHVVYHVLEVLVIVAGLLAVALSLVPHDGLHVIAMGQLRQRDVGAGGKAFGKRLGERLAIVDVASVGIVAPYPPFVGAPNGQMAVSGSRVDGRSAVSALYCVEFCLQRLLDEVVGNVAESKPLVELEVAKRTVARRRDVGVSKVFVPSLEVIWQLVDILAAVGVRLPRRYEH